MGLVSARDIIATSRSIQLEGEATTASGSFSSGVSGVRSGTLLRRHRGCVGVVVRKGPYDVGGGAHGLRRRAHTDALSGRGRGV